MIQKLKRHFILIYMLFVSIVLLVVFSGLAISSYKKMKMAIRFDLEHAFNIPAEGSRPRLSERKQMDNFPFSSAFTVFLDEDNQITSVRTQNLDLADEDLSSLITSVMEQEKEEGTVPDLHLHYRIRYRSGKAQLAFVNTSYQTSSFRYSLLQYFLGFSLSFAAFFCISLFLASLSIKPVEKSWTQQKQFIADASHELKTPLTVILANLDILEASPQATIQSQRQWLSNTREEARHMKELVQQLLFLARADAEERAPIFHTFSLSDAAWSCALAFEPVAYEKKITLTEEIEPNLTFTGDEQQIRQLFSILLDNGCKYGKAGGELLFSLRQQDDSIRLDVSNDGPPIPPEDLPHLFERFYRSDKARNANGSFGLGLAIAQTIAQAHKGTIQVESSEQKKTTFSVIWNDTRSKKSFVSCRHEKT